MAQQISIESLLREIEDLKDALKRASDQLYIWKTLHPDEWDQLDEKALKQIADVLRGG